MSQTIHKINQSFSGTAHKGELLEGSILWAILLKDWYFSNFEYKATHFKGEKNGKI